MSVELTMKSYNSTVVMTVPHETTFSEIACEYGLAGHAPPSGVELTYERLVIKGSDTPRSLGINSSAIIQVAY